MHLEQPAYGNRTFYGPLELSQGMPQNGDRYISVHPTDPTKLVRASGQGEYVDINEMAELVYATQQTLEGMSRYGINHVNPQYIDQTSSDGDPHLVTVVDKLENVIPYGKLSRSGRFTEEQLREIDTTLSALSDYTLQAIRDEGYISPELMALDQFVYDASQASGRQMVLVDVEPRDGFKIEANRDSMKHGYPSQLMSAVAKLVIDVIMNANRTSGEVKSIEKVAVVIDELPGDSAETVNAKILLLQALDSKTISRDVMLLVVDDADDEDEEWILN